MGVRFYPGPAAGPAELTDPGSGGTITSTANSAIVPIESSGIESRTLAAPDRIAQRLVIYDKLHGGQVTITAPTLLDASANTQIRLTAARATIELISIVHGGIVKWQTCWYSPEVTLASP